MKGLIIIKWCCHKHLKYDENSDAKFNNVFISTTAWDFLLQFAELDHKNFSNLLLKNCLNDWNWNGLSITQLVYIT